MTASQQPKERCTFQSMCKCVTVGSNLICPVDNGNWKSCKHDTRSRPHPSPVPDEQEHLIKNLKAICKAQNEKLLAMTEIRILYEQLEKMQPEHDAAIARQEHGRVLDDICNNCGGLADGGEQCKSCYVKSLRSQQQAGEQG